MSRPIHHQLLILILLWISQAAWGQTQIDPDPWANSRIQGMDSLGEAMHYKYDEFVFLASTDTVGVCRSIRGRDLTNDPHQVGSLSKILVALGILKLQEQGRVNLNDEVTKHLSTPKLDNPWEKTDPVRIVHLLEHSTGLDDMHFNEYYHHETRIVPLAEALERNPGSKRVRWAPGTCQAYSNVGYALAGRIIEVVTDTAFPVWMEANILRPLGMIHSFFAPQPVADGDEEAYRRQYLYAPAMGLVSTVTDLESLCTMLLHHGNLNGRQLFKPESIDRMFRSESLRTSHKGWWDGEYSLGWQVWTSGEQLRVRATGLVDGYIGMINLAPGLGRASILLLPAGNSPEEFVREANNVLWFPFRRDTSKNTAGEMGDLQEGTYLLLSTRHSLLDFRERVISEMVVTREGEYWLGKLSNGSSSILVPSSVRPPRINGRHATRVFIDRDSTGIRGLLLNGQYFVPVDAIWGSVLRGGLSFWKWYSYGFMALGLVLLLLRRNKVKGRPSFPIGLLAIAPYWLYLFAATILNGSKYYEFGTISSESVFMLLFSWAGFLVSILLPLIWGRLFYKGQRSMIMYASIPLILANLSATIYLFSYGVVPFASWLH